MTPDPLSLKCELVLKDKPTKEICFDFREVRRRAMCETWKIFEEKKVPFKEARKLGWDETKKKCAEIGAFI
jgi:hypothetical protein